MRIFGDALFQYHEVQSSSGGFNFHFQWRPVTPNAPPFYAEGLSSGKLYEYSNGFPINHSFHLAAGEVRTIQGRERYVAADGSKLFNTFILHLTVNANGVLTVSRVESTGLTCG